MAERTVIIHGWSDCSASFAKMRDFLSNNGFDAQEIFFFDYESREDSITYNDVIDGLEDKLTERGLIAESGPDPFDLNVIVHSTGGLVIRDWISRFYATGSTRKCPVKRLVMFAPANFGSPLAHWGKSIFGALGKGQKNFAQFLETGQQILDGLELASAFQWELAHRDVIVDKAFYTADDIQLTVIVGADDYNDYRKLVNRPGTDGTVVISGTSLLSRKLVLDFAAGGYQWEEQLTYNDQAFAVVANCNHGTIVDAACLPGSAVSNLLLEALKTTSKADFENVKQLAARQTKETYTTTQKPKYQQFIVRAVDDFGVPVGTYTLEFFIAGGQQTMAAPSGFLGKVLDVANLSLQEQDMSTKVHKLICGEFHTFSRDPAYRRFLVDRMEVEALVRAAGASISNPVLAMKIHVPPVEKGIAYDTAKLQTVVILDTSYQDPSLPTLFFDNTTTLVEVRLNRINNYVSLQTEPLTQRQRDEQYAKAVTGT